MDDRSYSTLGRHGLASSYSYLDGVPFKIGHGFKQPPKVVTPPELSASRNSNAIHEEYSFETEEAVLAWAKAREEALKEATEEQARKLQQAAEAAQKAAEEEAAKEGQEDGQGEAEDNQKPQDHRVANQSEDGIYDVPGNSSPAQSQDGLQPSKPAVPPKPPGGRIKVLSEPGTILKPTPIRSNAGTAGLKMDGENAVKGSGFDVSMFESEIDPFDNLELQTLNDMEELKVLLDSSSKADQMTGCTQAPASQSQTYPVRSTPVIARQSAAPGTTDSIYDVATVVPENAWETFTNEPVENGINHKNDATVTSNGDGNGGTRQGSPVVTDTSEQVQTDGEYVELTSNIKKQTVSFQNHTINGVNKPTSAGGDTQPNSGTIGLGGKLPPTLANSKLYKPVLPPISKAEKAFSDVGSTSNPFNPKQAQTNPFLQKPTQDNQNPFYQNTPEQWTPFTKMTGEKCGSGGLSQDESTQPSSGQAATTTITKPSPLSPPTVNMRPTPAPRTRQPAPSARMWSSVGPSLAASLDDSSSSERVTNNPYSRHSLSSSDLQASTTSSDTEEPARKSPVPQKPMPSIPSAQPWSRHRPLPPTPSSSPAPEVYKASQLPPSQPVGLTDPYHSLSREDQAFTDRLTSMGFLRARVARAVAKFGQDDKEVLDHLLAVDNLMEKKYAPVLVESALYTYKNDGEKAEKFLMMLTQFEELGFKSDKIQEALVTANLDHDKALDMLTA